VSLILMMVGVAALDINAQRQAAIDDQRRGLEQLGRVLAEDMSRYARVVDVVLHDVQAHIAEMKITTPAQFHDGLSDPATYAFLHARAHELPAASALSLVDSNGRVVNLSRAWPPPEVNVSDRDCAR
jgi:hypothetical protein